MDAISSATSIRSRIKIVYDPLKIKVRKISITCNHLATTFIHLIDSVCMCERSVFSARTW